MSVNASSDSGLEFTAELGTAEQKATYTLKKLITITKDALKKHDIDTVELYATEDFRTVALDGEVALDNPTLRKAFTDVITGFAFFKNLEGLYLELQQESYAIPEGIKYYNKRNPKHPKLEGFFNFRGTAGHFRIYKKGNISAKDFREKYAPRISTFTPFLSVKGMSISLECGLLNSVFEGVWYLLTGEEGFFLQPIESHAKQNTLFINKLKSKKILLEIDSNDNEEKIVKLQALIKQSDKAKALMLMKDLERWVVILPDLLDSSISHIIYKQHI